MLYLLDASVLITAHNNYYAIDRVPEFWDWLLHHGTNGAVKIPVEIMEEIKAGHKDDPLLRWLQDNGQALKLKEEVDPILVQRVLREGYAEDLTDDEIEVIGRDPFLIAYAMVAEDRCVVTAEVSSSKKQRQNRKIPDVCKTMGAGWRDPFAFFRALDFRTSWRKDR